MSVYVTMNCAGAFGGMPQERVREDYLLVRETARALDPSHGPHMGLQEMFPARYRTAYRNVFGPTLLHQEETSPGIGYDHRTERLISYTVHPGHDRIPGVCDARPIIVALMEDKATGDEYARIATHPCPGAWLPGLRPRKRARRAAWKLWRRRLLQITRALVEAGTPVQIAMDANARFTNVLGTVIGGQPVQYVRHDLDWLCFIGTPTVKWRIDRDTRTVIPTRRKGHPPRPGEVWTDHAVLLVVAERVYS